LLYPNISVPVSSAGATGKIVKRNFNGIANYGDRQLFSAVQRAVFCYNLLAFNCQFTHEVPPIQLFTATRPVMSERALLMNPYVVDRPITGRQMFFGREAVFGWVQQSLTGRSRSQVLLLYGERRSGKTSLLRQIEAGRLGAGVMAVYVNLAELARDSLSSFLWELAQQMAAGLSQRRLSLPLLDRDAFVADPGRAFREQFLRPLVAQVAGHLLLLGDEVGALASRERAGYLEGTILDYWQTLLEQFPQLAFLFTFTGRPSELPEARLLEEAERQILGPLTEVAATALICQPVPYSTYQPVRRHIIRLTGGQPYELQRLCHALFERWRSGRMRQVTMADVVAVSRLGNGAGPEPFQLRLLPSVNGEETAAIAAGNQPEPIQPYPVRTRRWRPAFPLLGLVLMALLAGYWLVRAVDWPAGLASAFSNFAGGTTVVRVTATPSPQPVVVATEAETERTEAPPLTRPAPTPTHTRAAATVTMTPTNSATATPEPTATATVTALPLTYEREADGMVMMWVPAGTFVMGSPENDYNTGPDELPQHEVTLSAFYIDKYEINVAQFAAFLTALGGYEELCGSFDCGLPRQRAGFTSYIIEEGEGAAPRRYIALDGYENFPANHVSWYGASAYCQWVGGRLPTEAEWEYGARGSDGRLYPWGEERPNPFLAVFNSVSFEDLKPVDALPDGASPFGALAMAGSMWEWVSDWYDEGYYAESPAENPTGPNAGSEKVARGGAWPNNNLADRIRTTNRSANAPNFVGSAVGFRCVVPLTP
jgi:formylglycine-generating enzyme required for sulfatase activity